MMPKFDICIIGHVTRDIIRIRDVTRKIPGGTAYYTSLPLQRLGLNVAVITKLAAEDKTSLLNELKQNGITIFCGESPETTIFENIYHEETRSDRVQKVRAIATSFSPRDIDQVSAPVFHLGPLTKEDIPLKLLEELSKRNVLISLDIQGFIRNIENEIVRESDWAGKQKGLVFVDILKANINEARILTGEDNAEQAASRLAEYGPREIIVTLGNKGSVIYSNKQIYRIPAFPPKKIVDPTGCGDTYIAGYLYQRLRSSDHDKIGRFAAKLATLKLETFGSLQLEGEALRTLTSDLDIL
ncbi:MAG: PfkB family carbohydrate kinase [Candidatus Heimdallarchaeota archaeon]